MFVKLAIKDSPPHDPTKQWQNTYMYMYVELAVKDSLYMTLQNSDKTHTYV